MWQMQEPKDTGKAAQTLKVKPESLVCPEKEFTLVPVSLRESEGNCNGRRLCQWTLNQAQTWLLVSETRDYIWRVKEE